MLTAELVRVCVERREGKRALDASTVQSRVLDYYVTDASSYAVTYVTVVPMISRSLLAITISLEAPFRDNTTE